MDINEQTKDDVVAKAVRSIKNKVRPEIDGAAIAQDKLTRCNAHVSELLQAVSDLPKQLTKLEAELDERIAEGKPVVTVEKKISDLQTELNRDESWLNNKSDEFLSKASIAQRQASSKLQQAVQSACDCILESLNAEADKTMAELFGIFESWRQICEGLSAEHLPRPMYKMPIHCGGFVSTIQTDREKLLRYKRMTDVFPSDVARGKYIHQDKLFAERKAKEDAEARIVEGNRKRSVSMKAYIAKQKANILNEGKAENPDKTDEGFIDTGVTVDQARDIINASLNETGLNEEKIRELTREAIAATTT